MTPAVRRPPISTYRIQVHAGFTLEDVARMVPSLAQLGISHVYLSPIAEAMPGSTHGYDVVDPTRVSSTLGGEPALRSLARTLRTHGMGALIDIVPNHMAASTENPWWASLLEHGAASPHAATFDTPLATDRSARLRIPLLGAPLADVLARGELRVATRDGHPVLQYHDNWFPVPAHLHAAARAAQRDASGIETLLDALPYELVYWQRTGEAVCYRRFFDVAALVGVRVEDPAVFARTHAGVLDWIANGWIDALRIDHIDGLRDPARYLGELAEATARAAGGTRCYTVVEKILGEDEELPAGWETDGPTGYEFASLLSGYFVLPAGYRRLDRLRRDVTGEQRDFATFAHDAQRDILDMLFPAELADVSARIAEVAGTPADRTRTVVRELTAALPVYRTYIDAAGVSAQDRHVLGIARARAAAALDEHGRGVLDIVVRTLLLERAGDGASRTGTLDAIARWQQLSGPAMAKGYEDTALYGWPTLLALNDVGAHPETALDGPALHAAFARRAERTPRALNAGSTHDAKRSEDVRARLLVLAEHADEWASTFPDWLTQLPRGASAVSARDAIVLLQTIVGIWPLDGEPDAELAGRVRGFMRKAAREAKQETSWHAPDERYEAILDAAVDHVLLSPGAASLRAALRAFARRLELHGAANSLCQLVLRCAAPGIPDVYQGNGRWRFDLVDPDNRRPVDFEELEQCARQLRPLVERPTVAGVRALVAGWRDGRIKQYVLMAALAARARSTAFMGAYAGASIVGEHADQAFAFVRSNGSDAVVAVATRWPGRAAAPDALLTGAFWGNTRLHVPHAHAAWRCIFAGTELRLDGSGTLGLAEVLAHLPFALLEPA